MKTIDFKKDYLLIKDIIFFRLKSNDSKPISSRFLKREYDLSTIQLQSIIHSLRVDGIPILAKGNLGYYYSEDEDEILISINSLKTRANNINKAAIGMEVFINDRKNSIKFGE